MGGDSIAERKKRYYKLFDIQDTMKSKGGGVDNESTMNENIMARKESVLRKSIMNPGKVRSTLKCDDKVKSVELRRILMNNMIIARRSKSTE